MLPSSGPVLVLGLGNRLLSDDAAGPLVIDRLAALRQDGDRVVFLDGGTMGLSLLVQVEKSQGFIAIDAAALGKRAGSVQVFEGAAMERQLGGRKRTAHEVALADLLAAAALTGNLPPWRALVAVEPQTTAIGMTPSPAVTAALPQMCTAVEQLLHRWRN